MRVHTFRVLNSLVSTASIKEVKMARKGFKRGPSTREAESRSMERAKASRRGN